MTPPFPHLILAFTVEEPVGIALALVLATMAVVTFLRWKRQGAAGALCFAAASLAALLIADLRITQADSRSPNIVLVDISRSFRPVVERNWPLWRLELERLLAADARPAQLIFFDSTPRQPVFLSPDQGFALPAALPETIGIGTNLDALAARVPAKLHRLVVLSDGAFAEGKLELLAPLPRLQVFRPDDRIRDGVRIADAYFRGRTLQNTESLINLWLEADTTGTALVEVALNGAAQTPPLTHQVELSVGQRMPVSLVLPADWWQGRRGLEVTLNVSSGAADDLPENNAITLQADAPSRPLALVVGPYDRNDLGAFLIANGYDIKAMKGVGTLTTAELAAADLVVLSDVDDAALGADRGRTLLESLTTFGITLLVSGRNQAFGPGGYTGGPLEAVLPVNVTPDDAPPMLHVLLLDASASMGGLLEGQSKFALQVDAAESYLERLSASHASITLVFNEKLSGEQKPLARDEAVKRLQELARTTRPQGGTRLRGAMAAALEAVATGGGEFQEKHLVVVTDGESTESEPTDQVLLSAIASSGTQVTIVVVADSVPDWLAALQRESGGSITLRHHADLKQLGAKLKEGLREAEERFLRDRPTDFRFEGLLALQLEARRLNLTRWVATSLKPGGDARAHAVAEDGSEAPLVASWNFGRSRVIALMAETHRDDGPLAGSPSLQRVLLQLVGAVPNVEIQASHRAGKLHIELGGWEALPLDSGVRAAVLGEDGRSWHDLEGRRAGVGAVFEFREGAAGILAAGRYVRIEGYGELAGLRRVLRLPDAIDGEFLPPLNGQAAFLERVESAGLGLVGWNDEQLVVVEEGEGDGGELVWVVLVSLISAVLACVWVARSS